MIPRIRGKIGVFNGDSGYKGKYFFSLYLSSVGGGDGVLLGEFGPWDTEEIAMKELHSATKLACESIEMKVDGKVSGKYLDMKTNTMREW